MSIAGKSKKYAMNLLVLVISLLVSSLVAELVLHIFVAGGPPKVPTQFFEYNAELGWSKIPNRDGWYMSPEYTVHKKMNSKGLRGPECPYQKPENEYRILCLGDSYCEGISVDIDDLFITRLEEALNDRDDGRDYRVINGGTSAYSNDQELLFFEIEGHKYNPDLVILLVCLNDIWHNIRNHYGIWPKPVFEIDDGELKLTNSPVPEFVIPEAEPPDEVAMKFTAPAIKEWLNENSRIYSFIRRNVRSSDWLYRVALKLGLAHKIEAPDMPPIEGVPAVSPLPEEYKVWNKTPPPDIKRAWLVTEAILARLKRKVRAAGAELLVFYIPDKGSVEEKPMRTTMQNYGLTDEHFDLTKPAKDIKAICDRLSISCIEPTEQFRQEALRLGKLDRGLHFKFDGHWSKDGNRFVAKILQDEIEGRFLKK
ncbi:MAG: SGNH/GDSL hydrolase family protein [Candidatus Coatesbacteria bacterium]|nr:SGNH/GDSL hydrolase family protein [Candidatus Coatesbacteria bacterium]